MLLLRLWGVWDICNHKDAMLSEWVYLRSFFFFCIYLSHSLYLVIGYVDSNKHRKLTHGVTTARDSREVFINIIFVWLAHHTVWLLRCDPHRTNAIQSNATLRRMGTRKRCRYNVIPIRAATARDLLRIVWVGWVFLSVYVCVNFLKSF